MELRVLRNFIAVVQEEGVTAAADVLSISQPALSRQIKELEKELGTQLLVRGNRGRTLELTDEGRLLYRRAQEIAALAERTASEIAAQETIEGSSISPRRKAWSCARSPRPPSYCTSATRRFLSGCTTTTGANIVERLDNRLADFDVLAQPTDMSRYDHMPLPGGDPMGVLLRQGHPLAALDTVTTKDLKGVPVIVPQGVLARRDLSGWFGRNAKSLDIVGTMNLMYNASCFVQEGYGCAIGPAGLVSTSPDSELTFRPLDPPMSTQLAIAWKKNQPLTPAANAFLDALREVVQPRGDSEA